MSVSPLISVQNISASYGQTKVLKGLCLSLIQGESYALIGPSGSGKSTLLKVLCGIHKEFTGDILYNNHSFFDQNISIGYVPQTFGLLDWKTVKDNIYLPLKLNREKKVSEDSICDIINTLEINDLLNRYPLELSGGQRQRVALARAFAYRPELLLMDEPFSSLDSFTSARSQKLYLKLSQKYNITTLFITHNIFEAVATSQRILLMDKSSGKIQDEIKNISFNSDNKQEQLEVTSNIMNLFEQYAV